MNSVERKKKIALAVIAAMALGAMSAGCGGGESSGGSGSAEGATAVEMRIQKTVGSVKLTNDKGEEQTLMEKMRLASGNALITAKESLANVSLDDTKLVTIEESSKVQIKGNSQNLEIHCLEGNLFINVTEKVQEGASLDIHVGNIVCGSRATSGYHGKDNEGNDMVMTTDGEFEVTATDENGNTTTGTAGPGEKIVLKKKDNQGSGPNITLEKSGYKPEELPPLALDAINNDEGLMNRVTGSTDFSQDKITRLAEAMSRDDGNGGRVPIMGHEGRLLSEAAVKAEEIAKGDVDLQVAIINGVKTVLENATQNGASDEELTKVAEQTTGDIKKAVEDMENSGKTKEDIIKGIEGMNGGNTPPAGTQGNLPGTNNVTNPQTVPGNITGEQQAEGTSDNDYDRDTGSGGGSGRKKKEETPATPETPAEPETPAPTEPSQESNNNEQQQQQQPPNQTTGEAVLGGDGIYRATLSNGTYVQFTPDANGAGPKINVLSDAGSPLILPIGITVDGTEIPIYNVTSVYLDNIPNVTIQCTDSAATIVTHSKQYWSSVPFTASNTYTTVTCDQGSISASTGKGTTAGIVDFIGAFHGTGIYLAYYGVDNPNDPNSPGIRFEFSNPAELIIGSGYTFTYKSTENVTDDYVEVIGETGGAVLEEKRYRLHKDATITEVE